MYGEGEVENTALFGWIIFGLIPYNFVLWLRFGYIVRIDSYALELEFIFAFGLIKLLLSLYSIQFTNGLTSLNSMLFFSPGWMEPSGGLT